MLMPTTWFREMLIALVSQESETVAELLADSRADFGWLRVQGLLQLTSYLLHNDSQLSSELTEKVQQFYFSAGAVAVLRQRELFRVLQHLAAGGIVPVLLKGAALAYTVYPAPLCRPAGDIDLWVTVEEMPQAQAILEQLGYVYQPKSSRPLPLMFMHKGEIKMVSTHSDAAVVELQWGAFHGEWMRRVTAIDEDAMRARAVKSTLADLQVCLLSSEDNILQLIFHFAINHKLDFPLRALVDIAFIVQTQTVKWDELVRRAQDWRLSTVTWLVLILLQNLTGLEEMRDAILELSPSPLQKYLLGYFIKIDSILWRRERRKGIRGLIFQLLLVDRAVDALRLIGRTFWPEQEWLQARYDKFGIGVRLRHIGNIITGRL